MSNKDKMNGKNIEYMLLGQTSIYCEQVITGAKLCAQLLFKEEYLPMVKSTIKRERCKVIFFSGGKNFKVAFIYRYDFARFIIHELAKRSEKKIPSAFEIWASGKMFGYSDHEISKYLKRHGYLNKEKKRKSLPRKGDLRNGLTADGHPVGGY